MKKPLALRVSVYSTDEREAEYRAVIQAGVAGYTEPVGDRESDEVVYLVKPEDLEGRTLDYLDEETLEASLADYFEVLDVYAWQDDVAEGKVEEVEDDEHTLPLLTFE